MEIINIGSDKYKISDNKIFLLKLPNPNEIYIKSSFISNIESQNSEFFNNMILNRQTSRIKQDSILKDYTKYSLNKEYEIKGEKNDCLLFAERVSLNDLKYSRSASVFSVNLGKSSKKFGISDKDNSKIVTYTRKHSIANNRLHNFKVNPAIGDAYSMVPYITPIDTGTCPYHVATVVFKDGDTNITIEADAGIKLDKPIFDMYSVSLFKHSFFINHVKTYLDTKVDSNGKIHYKVPTVLHLKKTYKSPLLNDKTKEDKIKEDKTKEDKTKEDKTKESIRIQPMRRTKQLAQTIKTAGSNKKTKKTKKTKKNKKIKKTKKIKNILC